MFSGRNDISNSNIHQTGSSHPDYKVDKYMHYQYYATPVFGEMKIAQYNLYRIAIFMKNEIDEKNLDLAIGFQVVGLRICFYVMKLSSCGVYKFVELCSLQLPKNIDDLLRMVLLLEPISNISRIYKEKCIKSSMNLQRFQCQTLPQDMVDNLLARCKSKQTKDNIFYRKVQ
ncbi:hypothetical protein BDF21DRAFT_454938 [Thamnidium elegans]|nr:hypothetical protein BDF21DRAFT_454938 [Thamnidium elegans]